jgi:CDP-glycerol glycerophosphotransferase (TagB/SpsB family)
MNKLLKDFLCGFIIPFIDYFYPKNKNTWGFSVHHIKSDQFVENARAVFETIKKDPDIHKILFVRDNSFEFGIEDAVNFEIVKLWTFKGIFKILSAKVLFVTHSLSMDYSIRFGKSQFSVLKLNMSKRHVVNLWHGIPFKKLYALWNPLVKARLDRVEFRKYERKKYAGLISSSDIDSYAMATMFFPIQYDNLWVTGLPRNDFLLTANEQLPTYLKNQVENVKVHKGAKRLVVYAPTYRQTAAVGSAEYYQFNENEISELKRILSKHNAVLGIRLHYFRNNANLFNIEKYIDGDLIIDVGHKLAQEIAPVIREADLVISDYSSVFIEAMYVNKPLIAFAYDFDNYRDEQDGVLYDYEMVFPGPIVKNTQNLFEALDFELGNNAQINSDKYRFSQKLFFNHIDANNSGRVVEKVKAIL